MDPYVHICPLTSKQARPHIHIVWDNTSIRGISPPCHTLASVLSSLVVLGNRMPELHEKLIPLGQELFALTAQKARDAQGRFLRDAPMVLVWSRMTKYELEVNTLITAAIDAEESMLPIDAFHLTDLFFTHFSDCQLLAANQYGLRLKRPPI